MRAAETLSGLTGVKVRRLPCASHLTEPGWNLHKPEDIGIDAFQADRAPDRAYGTTPLRALWDSVKIHKGGFYHDDRFATLQDVVDHYNTFMKLGLTTAEIRDLIEYLKSL